MPRAVRVQCGACNARAGLAPGRGEGEGHNQSLQCRVECGAWSAWSAGSDQRLQCRVQCRVQRVCSGVRGARAVHVQCVCSACAVWCVECVECVECACSACAGRQRWRRRAFFEPITPPPTTTTTSTTPATTAAAGTPTTPTTPTRHSGRAFLEPMTMYTGPSGAAGGGALGTPAVGACVDGGAGWPPFAQAGVLAG